MAKKNKKSWVEMSRSERRVAVAKDVIKQIQAGNIEGGGGYGSYVVPRGATNGTPQEAAKNIIASANKCSACARGCMLLSKLSTFNHSPKGIELFRGKAWIEYGKDLVNVEGEGTAAALKDCFSELELSRIESAYEVSTLYHAAWEKYEESVTPLTKTQRQDAHDCVDFGRDFDDHTDRIIAIMQNIIDHDGKFTPKVRYVVEEV